MEWKVWSNDWSYSVSDFESQFNLVALYTFVPYKSFGQLLYITPKNFIFLKTFNSEQFYIEKLVYWLKPLEIEDKINITAVIN